MRDPVRLVSGEADEFERELIESAKADVPPADGLSKTILGFGAMGAAGAATASAHAAEAIATGSSAGVSATAGTVAKAASLGSTLTLKWIAGGMLAGAVVAGTQLASFDPPKTRSTQGASPSSVGDADYSGPSKDSSPSVRPAPSELSHEALQPGAGSRANAVGENGTSADETQISAKPTSPASAPLSEKIGRIEDAKTMDRIEPQKFVAEPVGPTLDPSHVEAPAKATGPANAEQQRQDLSETSLAQSSPTAPMEPTRRRSGGLADETALLDSVRSSLANGDTGAALSRLAEYQRSFVHGVLRPEATVLTVEALVRLGRRAEAEQLALPLLRGTSAHAAKTKQLLGLDP